MAVQHSRGALAEEAAARYLAGKGYKVVARNVRFRRGEIDIVAWDEASSELVFVEVKARSSRMFGWPEEAVTRRKGVRLQRAAGLYLLRNPSLTAHRYRFDIVALEIEDRAARVTHYKNIEFSVR